MNQFHTKCAAVAAYRLSVARNIDPRKNPANITITTQRKDDVVIIPNQALRRFGGRKYVQIIAENARKREVDVETGIATDTETEIIKGIKEGTRVVSQ